MKGLLFGIFFIIVIGVGGLVYRNAVEHPNRPIACPMDARVCPDGTAVAREGISCTFSACPPPNVSLSDVGISFAVPEGFTVAEFPDSASVAAYNKSTNASTSIASIIIRRYFIDASSASTTSPQATALSIIQQTAIGSSSGAPVPVTAFSSTALGAHRFTVVSIERFEGVVDTAYYLTRTTDVLRFDAIDRGVANWTSQNLNTAALPAATALRKLLTTLEGV